MNSLQLLARSEPVAGRDGPGGGGRGDWAQGNRPGEVEFPPAATVPCSRGDPTGREISSHRPPAYPAYSTYIAQLAECCRREVRSATELRRSLEVRGDLHIGTRHRTACTTSFIIRIYIMFYMSCSCLVDAQGKCQN